MKILIVNEQDQIINMTLNSEIDEDLEGIYRVTGLWIMDQKSNVLLSKRALTKPYNPGLWGPAVMGIVEEGETYESHIRKESKINLGLDLLEEIIPIPKTYIETNRKYFVQTFIHLVSDSFNEFILNDTEVAEIKWFSRSEIESLLVTNPEKFMLYLVEIFDLLKQYKTNNF